MSELEQILQGMFVALSIDPVQQRTLTENLEKIKHKDQATYEHSIRVALLGVKVARNMNLNPKPLFYSGLLHDIGKILVDKELLAKKGVFDEEDRKKMKKHPEYAYYLIKDMHDFTAEIIVRHHRSQKDPYPEELPPTNKSYPLNKKLCIGLYARILSLVDFYDAITTRNNGKYGAEKLTPKQRKKIVLESYPDQAELIEKLYADNVFDNVQDDSGCQKDL